MIVVREIEIAASPERVYDLIADSGRLGDWVTIHQYVQDQTDEPLVSGSELSQCLKLAGQRFTVRWRVVEAERPTRLVWTGRGPMRSNAMVRNILTPSEKGTHFSYTNQYELPGGPLGRMAGPMVKRVTGGELEKSLARLKLLLE